jgi:hypothetical protein
MGVSGFEAEKPPASLHRAAYDLSPIQRDKSEAVLDSLQQHGLVMRNILAAFDLSIQSSRIKVIPKRCGIRSTYL